MADSKQIIEALERIVSKMRVTKVVATRSVKTRSGDFFAGISSAWDSTQDDAGGPGPDLDLLASTEAAAVSGMTMTEARIAHIMLAVEATTAAWRAAVIDGAVTENEFHARVGNAKKRASTQISAILDHANKVAHDRAPAQPTLVSVPAGATEGI